MTYDAKTLKAIMGVEHAIEDSAKAQKFPFLMGEIVKLKQETERLKRGLAAEFEDRIKPIIANRDEWKKRAEEAERHEMYAEELLDLLSVVMGIKEKDHGNANEIWAAAVSRATDLQQRLAAAEGVIKKLPVSADGVPITPGMVVHTPNGWALRVYLSSRAIDLRLAGEEMHSDPDRKDFGKYFSTREAAQAALAKQPTGETK